jgi:hypothetical protein
VLNTVQYWWPVGAGSLWLRPSMPKRQVVTGREYFAPKEAVSLTCSPFFYIGENSPKREIKNLEMK